MKKIILIILFPTLVFSQNIDVNDNFINSKIRTLRLLGKLETNLSLNIKPLNSNNLPDSLKSNEKVIFVNKKENIKFKTLGIDYTIDFNSHHPYNRNNGTMIPNKGYQHLFSPGFFFELGPLQIQLKPEHHYSDNLKFDGFWGNN